MLIRMLETKRESGNGFIVQEFQKGEQYDVARNLAVRLINNGFAIDPTPVKTRDEFLADHLEFFRKAREARHA